MSKLIVPVGVPGCGKSTWGCTFFGEFIICSDDIRRRIWGSLIEAHNCTPEEKQERNDRIWSEFYEEVEEHLRQSTPVYADATNLGHPARHKLQEIAKRTNSEIHLIVFDNVLQGLARNTQREEDKRVPTDVMENFLRSYAMLLESLQAGEEEKYDSVTRIQDLGPHG
jgi:predicted kinase